MYELEFIKEKVENETSLKLETKSRDLDSTIARWLYFKIAKLNTGYSLNEIGRLVNRNHSTVVYGLKNVDYELNTSKALQHKYNMLDTVCKAHLNYKKVSDIDEAVKLLNVEIKKLLNIKQEFFKLNTNTLR
jgi:hypothetical protein